MNIVMLPAARAEMIRAARWYDRKGKHLGDRLLDDVRSSLLAILDFPKAFPTIDSIYRKKLLDVFPYALIYRIDGPEVTVIAVAHLKRKPTYWRERAG